MAKRTSNTSSITGETSTSTSTSTANRKIILRIKSSQNSSKKDVEDENSEKEPIPKSSKRSKSSLKRRKKKKKIDPNKPKKPPSAFFFFMEDFRKGYQQENPGVKNMRDIGKACGEKWKIMPFEEKVQYYDIASEKRIEFDRAMAEYIRRRENGEFAESDDSESEFDS